MIRIFLLFFIIVSISCKSYRNLNNTGQILQANDLFNDSTYINLDNKVTIITLIKEPCCTGCKEYLAKYLNSLSKKYKQFIILSKSEDILYKKSYQLFLSVRFKKNSGTYYSLSNNNISFKLNSKTYTFDAIQNPIVLVLSKKDKMVDKYNYQDIFNNVFIKESFKNSIKSY